MRSVLVAVDYLEPLRVTYPYNRHHFDSVTIVTDSRCAESVRHACPDADVFVTDAFYDDGALFNKWKALEQGLDRMGRHGWLCIMDADVLWPKHAPLRLEKGTLLSPLRRMCPDIRFVPEVEWGRYPVHRNIAEHAGYTQIFHASDPHLGSPPWHEQNWVHAGGADSFFQRKWPAGCKRRPSWDVLHLGPAGVNWAGVGHAEVLMDMLQERRRRGNFTAERLA